MQLSIQLTIGILMTIWIGFLLFKGRKSKQKLLKLHDENQRLKIRLSCILPESSSSTQRDEISNIFKGLVHQSPNAIMLMDREANILYINRGFEDMYEYTFESFTQMLGSNYRQTSFDAGVEQRLQYVLDNKATYRYEALNITKTGKEIWTQTALMPIIDNNGEVTHFVTIDTDINDRIIKSDHLINQTESLFETIDQLAIQYKKLNMMAESLFSGINDLYTKLDQTDSILAFIRSISDETRILGFNASIEASRAGKSGAGFRVITNEIVDISKKTIDSVESINNLIDSISKQKNEINHQKEDSTTQLKNHEQIISKIKKDLEEVQVSLSEFKSLT